MLIQKRYKEVTVDCTLAAARVWKKHSPDLSFIFVRGQGTDETESGNTMWARVKGQAEKTILAMGLPNVVAFRPGTIVPKRGLRHMVRRRSAAWNRRTSTLWPAA